MSSLRSVAITPDGNRRFAKSQGLSLESAYRRGFAKVDEVTEWALARDVKTLTVWGLSYDNFKKRSALELDVLFRLMRGYVRDSLDRPALQDGGVQVKFIGDLSILPKDLLTELRVLEDKTQDNDRLRLNLAVAYSGQRELLQAAASLARDAVRGQVSPEALDADAFAKRLWMPEPVDLVIRTGGMKRTSGFLPWQSEYAELWFSDALWPGFSKEEFDQAADWFSTLPRNFGR